MKYLLSAVVLLSSFGLFAQKEEIGRPDIPGDLMVDVGFDLLSDYPDSLKTDVWPSKSANISYNKRRALNDNFSFYYGIGLGLNRIGLGDSATLMNNDSVTFVAIPDGFEYEKNKLAIAYVDVPV